MLFPVVHPAMGTDVNFLMEAGSAGSTSHAGPLLPRAAEEGVLIAATRMPFPGLGRIVSDQGRLSWHAADSAYQD